MDKYKKKGEDYIFPFALFPITRGQALSGTPMENIQTGELSHENDIKSFLEALSEEKRISIGLGVNRKLHSYKAEINRILINRQNIVELARTETSPGYRKLTA